MLQKIHGFISSSFKSDEQMVEIIDAMLFELGDVEAEPIG